jgi:hypothetical protein
MRFDEVYGQCEPKIPMSGDCEKRYVASPPFARPRLAAGAEGARHQSRGGPAAPSPPPPPAPRHPGTPSPLIR